MWGTRKETTQSIISGTLSRTGQGTISGTRHGPRRPGAAVRGVCPQRRFKRGYVVPDRGFHKTCVGGGTTHLKKEPQGVFTGQLRTQDYGNLQFSTVVAGPHQTIRTPEMIDSKEDFFISLVTQGRGEIRQGDNRALLSNGAFTVVDGSRPFSFSFPADFEQIIIQVPRPDFLAHIPERRLDNVLAVPLPGHGGPSSLVSAVFRQAAQLTESVGGAVGEAMVLPMLDMFAVSLQGLADTSSETQIAHQRDWKRAQKTSWPICMIRSGP